MITQLIQLHKCPLAEIGTTMGSVFEYATNSRFGVVAFGNEFFWSRQNLWKIIEPIDESMVAEHICYFPKDNNLVIPLLSRHLANRSVCAFIQTYTTGLNVNLTDIDEYNNVVNSTPIASAILPAIVQETGIWNHNLGNIIDNWYKNNPDIDLISPTHTYFDTPNTDFNIYDHFIPITNYKNSPTNVAENAQWCNNGNIQSNRDLEFMTQNLSDVLTTAFDEVKHNCAEPDLLSDILLSTLAPWKRYTYMDQQHPIYNLSSRYDFIQGKMTRQQLSLYFTPEVGSFHQWYSPPNFLTTPLIGSINKEQFFSIPDFNKEFAALIEFVQSINLTDFCFKFDLNKLINGNYHTEVVYALHRHFPKLQLSKYLIPEVENKGPIGPDDYLEVSFSDYTIKLGEKLVDWILVQEKALVSHFSTVCLIRNFNEEFFIYFQNGDQYADAEIYYYDLIAGTICGRNMCNAKYQPRY